MDNACILHVYLVLIIITPILTGGSLPMCDNYSYTATNFLLTRVQTDSTNCTCFLRSAEQTTTKVEFNMMSFSGCKYKIAVYFNGSMSFLSCSSKSLFHTITSTTIKLNLEPGLEGSTETAFTMNITSTPETNLSLSCFTHNTTEIFSTQHVTMNFTSPRKESSTLTPTTDNPTLPPDSSAFTQTVQNSHVPVSSVYTSDIPVNKTNNMTTFPVTTTGGDKYSEDDNDRSGNDDVVTAGIIGGVIGCVIGGVIVGLLIFTIKRIVEHRKKKSTSEIYSSPSSHHQPESHYTDLQLS